MTDPISKGLLPEGFRDRLPPKAEAADALLRTLIDSVSAYGYERVMPPLVEFEDSLLTRLSNDEPRDLLRFVDPLSQHTLALRPDITPQVGRIAATRLANFARPLRLSYAGAVVRVRPAQVGPEREALQMGAELIGSDHLDAVTELLGMALETLRDAGLSGLSVDLTLPDLVQTLAAGPWPLDAASLPSVMAALDGKDMAALRSLGADNYDALIKIAGPADAAIKTLRTLGLAELSGRIDALERLVTVASPFANVTIDPTERHGFEYQSWIGFSLFSDGVRGEVGRGGSYRVRHPNGTEEPATGFSLFVDGLVDAGLGVTARKRVFLPLGTDATIAAKLRADGWTTLAALDAGDTAESLRCDYVLNGKEPIKVTR